MDRYLRQLSGLFSFSNRSQSRNRRIINLGILLMARSCGNVAVPLSVTNLISSFRIYLVRP